jgi:hypothetical protein
MNVTRSADSSEQRARVRPRSRTDLDGPDVRTYIYFDLKNSGG